jgi:hypothetical protein
MYPGIIARERTPFGTVMKRDFWIHAYLFLLSVIFAALLLGCSDSLYTESRNCERVVVNGVSYDVDNIKGDPNYWNTNDWIIETYHANEILRIADLWGKSRSEILNRKICRGRLAESSDARGGLARTLHAALRHPKDGAWVRELVFYHDDTTGNIRRVSFEVVGVLFSPENDAVYPETALEISDRFVEVKIASYWAQGTCYPNPEELHYIDVTQEVPEFVRVGFKPRVSRCRISWDITDNSNVFYEGSGNTLKVIGRRLSEGAP